MIPGPRHCSDRLYIVSNVSARFRFSLARSLSLSLSLENAAAREIRIDRQYNVRGTFVGQPRKNALSLPYLYICQVSHRVSYTTVLVISNKTASLPPSLSLGVARFLFSANMVIRRLVLYHRYIPIYRLRGTEQKAPLS